MRASSITVPWRRCRAVVVVALLLVTAACTDDETPGSTAAGSSSADRPVTLTDTGAETIPDADLVVRADRPGTTIDPHVFGTNVPAWLGPERLADPAFQRLALDAGVELVRMPGGSWSNAYDWLACEEGDAEGCWWTWAAKPSDFARFLQATGLDGMWTVSINETAQSAAALVAFFNGEVGDERPIGTDRDGFDWGTVGRWAELRVSRGIDRPLGIRLWEVGNEVYGGKPGSGGDQCAEFGWEDVWTCDGTTYVEGTGEHDGYLAIRRAMIDVDPTIEVGAVGVADPGSWSDWGNEVINAAGDDLDFYVVHQYGFDESPDPEDAVERPRTMWPEAVGDAQGALPDGVPIAITEYNLVSFEAGDGARTMTTAVNALYTADTLGQFVTLGVPIANHWNLANGTTQSGTDYGIIDVDDGGTLPAYDAFRAWSFAGEELVPFEGGAPEGVRVYPTRRADGSVVTVLVNLGGQSAAFTAGVAGLDTPYAGSLSSWYAERIDDEALVEAPVVALEPVAAGESVQLSLPPWSISVWEARVDG